MTSYLGSSCWYRGTSGSCPHSGFSYIHLMFHPSEQVAFSDFQSRPAASWNGLWFFSFRGQHLGLIMMQVHPISHFKTSPISWAVSCLHCASCACRGALISVCMYVLAQSIGSIPDSSIPQMQVCAGRELQSGLHSIPSMLPTSSVLTGTCRCCSSTAAQGNSCDQALLARDVCFPV